MATSTLRAIILGAAVILGVVGLTKAFPNAGAPIAPSGSGGQPSPSTSPTPSLGTSPSPSVTPQIKGVTVQVLNGSGVTGLAATVTKQIKKAGYSVKTPGNANHTGSTIVYYQAGTQARLNADFLRTRFFPGAALRPATSAANSAADITVILGEDASPSPSG